MGYYCSVCRTYHKYLEYQEPRRARRDSASINIDDLVEEITRRMRGEYTDTYMSQPKPKELTRDEKLQVMARQNESPSERDNARRMLKAKGLSW